MTLAGRITGRYGTRGPSLAGLLAVLAGLVAYTQAADWPVLIVAAFVMGLGHGVITPLVMAGAYRDLARAAIPQATIAATILVRVGSALGAAAFAVILQVLLRGASPEAAFAHSFWWAFGVVAACLLPAALIRA